MIHEIIEDIREKVLNVNVALIEQYIELETNEVKKEAAQELLDDIRTINARIIISLNSMRMSNNRWDRHGDIIGEIKQLLEEIEDEDS